MEAFHIDKKIYYHDTDCGGIVYYAKYLFYLEEGRSEYCASRGVNLAGLIEQGIAFPVVHLEVDYKSSARYADTVRIYSVVEKIGNSSVHFLQEIKKGDVLLVKAKTVWACIGNDFKARPVPDAVKKALL